MQIIKCVLFDRPLLVHANLAGWQQVNYDGQTVSETAATASEDDHIDRVHLFEIELDGQIQRIEIHVQTQLSPYKNVYLIRLNGQTVHEGHSDEQSLSQSTPTQPPEIQSNRPNSIGLLALTFKLFKSAKVVKVALVGASAAAYSWLFTPTFAAVIIVCIVFHEYGHIKAMQYFGMKTKGIYLIPFVGGLALGNDRINTRWQNVVIALMGPSFGMLLSLFALVVYWVTGNVFFAGVASLNALINLFNLLPILPLDGGQLSRSIAFSINHRAGIIMWIVGVLIGVYISYTLSLGLLALMLVIGSVEVLMEWRRKQLSTQLPMRLYGIVISAAWYLALVVILLAIIIALAASGDQILAVPLTILGG